MPATTVCAAGMSRSALYLSYRNKEDIFRSLAIRYFDEAIRDMEAALNRPHQSREHAMLAAFVAKDGKFMEAVLSTPHGEELMDAGFSVTGDLAAAMRACEAVARGIAVAPTRGLARVRTAMSLT